MRYLLYAYPDWLIQSYKLNPELEKDPIKHSALPRLMHSGLTNWMRVFEGVGDVPNDISQYQRYDVIHMNMTTHNVGYVKRLRSHFEMLDTEPPKIVVNPDYAPEMWYFDGRTDLFLEDVSKADRVFTVHPTISRTLSELLGKHVYTVPHPTDVTLMKKELGKVRETDPLEGRTLLVIAHSYDRNYLIPTWLIKMMQATVDFKAVMVGKIEREHMFLKTVYDEFYEVLPFPALINLIARVDCVIDTSILHSYGRVPVECAAVGTPCITHPTVYSGQVLFPDLQTDLLDARGLRHMIERVFEGDCSLARDPEYFGYEQSRTRFLNMVEGREEVSDEG